MTKITSSKDIIMLLLYARGHKGELCEPIQGRTRLMKMVFLFKEEILKKFNFKTKISEVALPDFSAYDYGPFSEKVYTDLEFLVGTGFVKVRQLKFSGPDQDTEVEETLEYEHWQANLGERDELTEYVDRIDEFRLSDQGEDFVSNGDYLGKFSKEQTEVLNKFKARCTGISLDTLLRYVYVNYPEMIVKSKIKEKYK